MAFQFDYKGETTATTANPISTNIFTASGTIVMVLCVAVSGTTPRTGGAPTHNNYEFTQASSTAETTTQGSSELWYLLNDRIAKSVGTSISLPNTGGHSIKTTAVSFSSTLLGKWATFKKATKATGSSSGPTTTLTTPGTPSVQIDSMYVNYSTTSGYTNSYTLLYITDNGSWLSGQTYYLNPFGGTFTGTWYVPHTSEWAVVSASFEEGNAPDLYSMNSIINQDILEINTKVLTKNIDTVNTVQANP
jgi:hypothetical protein